MADKELSFKITIDGISTEAAELEKVTLELQKLKKERSDLQKIAKDKGDLASPEEIAKLAAYRSEIDKLASRQKELNKVVDTADDSLNRMRAKLIKLKETYATVSAEERERMAPSIKDLNDKISSAEQAVGQFGRNVGNYPGVMGKLTQSFKEAGEGIKGSVENFKNGGNVVEAAGGIMASAMIPIGVAVTGVIGAFKSFTAVAESTGETMDKYEATIEGWKQGFEQIKRSIATMDFENFGKKVKDAIAEGRRYAEGLDDIDEKTRALKIDEAKTANTILELKKAQMSALSTDEEKIKAGNEIIRQEERLAAIRIGIAQQAYDNELDNVARIAFGTKDITDAMRNQVIARVSRDKGMMDSLEPAKQYLDVMNQISNLKAAEGAGGTYSTKAIDNSKEIDRLQKSITTEMKASYDLQKALNTATDPKYTLLQEKMVELERAKGSATENTMRVSTRLDSTLNKNNKDMTMLVEGTDAWNKAVDQIASTMASEVSKANLSIEEQIALLTDLKDNILPSLSSEQEQYNKDLQTYLDTKAKEQADWDKGVEEGKKLFAKNEEERAKIKVESDKKEEKEKLSKAEKVQAFEQAALKGAEMAADAAFTSKRNRLQAEMEAELSNVNLSETQKAAIRKKYAKEQQKIDISQAIINAALAVGNALTTKPFFPMGLIAASLAAVQAGIQVAAIKAQKFATGGLIQGGLQIHPDTSKDNTLIYVKQGETVLNQQQVAMLGGSGAMRRIGVPGYANGGYVGFQAPEISFPGIDYNKLASMINGLDVRLDINKVNSAQREIQVITQPQRI